MAKLIQAQVLAMDEAAKARVTDILTSTLALFANKKAKVFDGESRTYVPKDSEGEPEPPEYSEPQFKVNELVGAVLAEAARAYNLTATKDVANMSAKADVVVDDVVLIAQAPATFLVWLSNRLKEWESFIKQIPTLDPAQQWNPDSQTGYFTTKPVLSLRTKKVPVPVTLYPHTNQHPAQTQLVQEDKFVGTWTKVLISSAWPQTQRDRVLHRLHQLQSAVEIARHQANTTAAADQKFGEAIFGFIFEL